LVFTAGRQRAGQPVDDAPRVLVVPDEVQDRATYRTARRRNIRFSIALRRMPGKTASMASPEARSAAT
jgi:hypothetical protein